LNCWWFCLSECFFIKLLLILLELIMIVLKLMIIFV
jgi:hypothetical protein